MNDLTEPNASEADRIEGLAEGLYKRLNEETKALLETQLKMLGVDDSDFANIEGLTRHYFPDDSKALAQFDYKGHPILGLRIAHNEMGIEFDVVDPLKLETIKNQIHITESQKEDQDESVQ